MLIRARSGAPFDISLYFMIKKIQLENGMTVITVPQKNATSVTVQVFVKVGSRYEHRDINGVSHFIEHLLFKGTKKRPTAMDLTMELDRYGAEYNAFTGKDLTSYYVKIDAKKSALAVDLLHDMIFHSKFDAKEIQKERGVIIEEINMYEDNPRMHIDDMLEEALFGDHPLGWNIAGPRSVIKSVSREDILTYRDCHYIPSRMTIVMAGKIDSAVLLMLKKRFSAVKSPAKNQGDENTFIPFDHSRSMQALSFKEKQTEQTQLGLAFYGFPYGDARLPVVALLSTILGGSMSSRLFMEIRERRGLCYSISASHHALEDTGMFSIMAGLEKESVDEALQAIEKELQSICKKGVTDEEVKRAKDHLRGKLMLAFEDSAVQADWYGRGWVFQQKLETPGDRLKKIDRVTKQDIRAIANELFKDESRAIAVIGPTPPLAKKAVLG